MQFLIFSDLVDGLILLMESNYSDPVNLGNPDEYTMLDFANIILEEVGKQMVWGRQRHACTCMYKGQREIV